MGMIALNFIAQKYVARARTRWLDFSKVDCLIAGHDFPYLIVNIAFRIARLITIEAIPAVARLMIQIFSCRP